MIKDMLDYELEIGTWVTENEPNIVAEIETGWLEQFDSAVALRKMRAFLRQLYAEVFYMEQSDWFVKVRPGGVRMLGLAIVSSSGERDRMVVVIKTGTAIDANDLYQRANGERTTALSNKWKFKDSTEEYIDYSEHVTMGIEKIGEY